jgi:hypothetical protein
MVRAPVGARIDAAESGIIRRGRTRADSTSSMAGEPQPASPPDRAGLILVLLWFPWCGVYVFMLRPYVLEWAAQYVSSFPIFLHLIPLFAPLIVLACLLDWILPGRAQRVAQRETEARARKR